MERAERVQITLHPQQRAEARLLVEKRGLRLSPLIGHLLDAWIMAGAPRRFTIHAESFPQTEGDTDHGRDQKELPEPQGIR